MIETFLKLLSEFDAGLWTLLMLFALAGTCLGFTVLLALCRAAKQGDEKTRAAIKAEEYKRWFLSRAPSEEGCEIGAGCPDVAASRESAVSAGIVPGCTLHPAPMPNRRSAETPLRVGEMHDPRPQLRMVDTTGDERMRRWMRQQLVERTDRHFRI